MSAASGAEPKTATTDAIADDTEFEALVHKRLMAQEYIATLRSLPVFIVPAMCVAIAYTCLAVGWKIFDVPLTVVPLVIVTLSLMATLAEFYIRGEVAADDPKIPV